MSRFLRVFAHFNGKISNLHTQDGLVKKIDVRVAFCLLYIMLSKIIVPPNEKHTDSRTRRVSGDFQYGRLVVAAKYVNITGFTSEKIAFTEYVYTVVGQVYDDDVENFATARV